MGINNGRVSSSNIATYNLTSVAVTSATTLVDGRSYIADSASQIIFKLPAVLVPGTTFEVIGWGTGGWKIQTNELAAAQQVVENSNSTVASAYSNVDVITSNGQYDTIRLVVVNSTNVAVNYKNGPTILSGLKIPTGVVAYYRLDETSGDFIDLVNGYNMTRNGTVTSTTGKFTLGQTGYGASNYMTSSNAVFDIPQNAARNYAFDFWVKMPGAPTANGAFCQIGSNSEDISLGFNYSGGVTTLGVDNYANYYTYRRALYNISSIAGDNGWHLIVVTLSRGTSTSTWTTNVYIDSTKVVTNDTGLSYNGAGANTRLTVSQLVGGYAYLPTSWVLDDFAVWKTTLPTQQQITDRWKAGYGAKYIL